MFKGSYISLQFNVYNIMEKSVDREGRKLWIAQKTIKVDMYFKDIPLSIVV